MTAGLLKAVGWATLGMFVGALMVLSADDKEVTRYVDRVITVERPVVATVMSTPDPFLQVNFPCHEDEVLSFGREFGSERVGCTNREDFVQQWLDEDVAWGRIWFEATDLFGQSVVVDDQRCTERAVTPDGAIAGRNIVATDGCLEAMRMISDWFAPIIGERVVSR